MFCRGRVLASLRLACVSSRLLPRFGWESFAQDFCGNTDGFSSQLRYSFCTDTHFLEINRPLTIGESPAIPDWVKDSDGESCSNNEDDFNPPSLSYWIGKPKIQDQSLDTKSKVHEIADNDIDKVSMILKNKFESPDSVVEALDTCDVSVSHSLVEQVLRRFSFEWISAYGFFKWAQLRKAFVHSPDLCNMMVDNLGKTRKFAIMWELVEDMKLLEGYFSLDTMTIIMRRFAKAGKYEDAIKAFKNIESFGVKQDIFALNRLMDALVKQRSVESAKSVFSQFKDCIHPNSESYNVLVHGWCKSRQLDEAFRTVDEMKKHGFRPDSYTYTCFIEAFCRDKDFRRVNDILEEMEKKGCRSTVVTYTIVMKALAKAKETDKAMGVYQKMKANKCLPDASFYDVFIHALSKSGRLKDSNTVFDDMSKQGISPGVSTYNTLISIAAHNSQETKALDLLKKMKEKGCKPDSNTYIPLLKMCCNLGRMKVLSFLLSHMFENDISLDFGVYSLLINRLCRKGKLEMACSLFEELVSKGFVPMGCTFDLLVKQLKQKGMHREKKRVEEMASRLMVSHLPFRSAEAPAAEAVPTVGLSK